MNYKSIDDKAVRIAKEFRKTEADLLEIIIQVDRFKVFRKLGYNSLYQYVHQRLKISESQTYAFIRVARKSDEVPKLKEAVKKGTLTISKAKRITAVINTSNQDQWLQIAAQQTQRTLEREVALAKPETLIQERATYIVSESSLSEKSQFQQKALKMKLELGLSERTMIQLRRAQDLVSQKERKSINLATTIQALIDEYIKRHDPLEKAKRQLTKEKQNDSTKALKKINKLRPNEEGKRSINDNKPIKSSVKPSLRKVYNNTLIPVLVQ